MSRRRDGRAAQWREVRLRRVLAAALAGTAVVVGLTALRPAPVPTTSVVVAAHDVEAGERLGAGDLRTQQWPREVAPPDQPDRGELAGRRTIGPLRAGEAVTATRLLSARALQVPKDADLVVSIPLADPGLTDLLRPRDRVDVLDTTGETAARAATVLAVSTGQDSDADKGRVGPSIVVAVTRAEAGSIARARSTEFGGNTALLVAVSS